MDHDYDGHGSCVPSCRRCRIAELEAELAELRKDRARLRWLLARMDEFTFADVVLTDPDAVDPWPIELLDIAISEE